MELKTKIRILVVFALIMIHTIIVTLCYLGINKDWHFLTGVFYGFILFSVGKWYRSLEFTNNKN